MSLSKYEFKIPDKTKPIKREDRIPCGGPRFELIDFKPNIVNPEEVIGRKVYEIIDYVGSYGMGGPGFFGFRLDSEWLVIAIWGAATWIQFNGEFIEEPQNIIRGRFSTRQDEFNPHGTGKEITKFSISKFSFEIQLDQDRLFTLSESPDDTPVPNETERPPLFERSDDLRKSVFLAPTGEIWIHV